MLLTCLILQKRIASHFEWRSFYQTTFNRYPVIRVTMTTRLVALIYSGSRQLALFFYEYTAKFESFFYYTATNSCLAFSLNIILIINKFNNIQNLQYYLLKQQKMASQIQLQHKLAEVTRKLQLVCQSYLNLKQQLRRKDDQICRLRSQIGRIIQNQQAKQNSKIEEIRKKYEFQSTFRPIQKTIPRKNIETSDNKALKGSKSLSPYQFNKPLINKKQQYIYKEPIKSVQTQIKKVTPPLVFNIEESKINPNFPSLIDLNKKDRNYNLTQIDKNFEKELKKVDYENNNESEAQMLRQLWDQRDKQIKRMDDLFQSLNKRINNP